MTSSCPWQRRGSVELFFYDELDDRARDDMAAHLRICTECANALEELRMIREALASRPIVSAPPTGDWSGFMRRLDGAVSSGKAGFSQPGWTGRLTAFAEAMAVRRSVPRRRKGASTSYVGLFAAAALLAIVTLSVFFVAKGRSSYLGDRPQTAWRRGGHARAGRDDRAQGRRGGSLRAIEARGAGACGQGSGGDAGGRLGLRT